MIVGLNKEENDIINKIFRMYSNECDFYYYGSRVKGGFREFSDLDVMIKYINNKQVPFKIIEPIKILFDYSELKFSVNLVDYFDIKDNFFEKIKNHIVKAELYEDLTNKVIILNGIKCIEKSNIIKEFQELTKECFYKIDKCIEDLPDTFYEKYKENLFNSIIDITDSSIKQNKNIILDNNCYSVDNLKYLAKKLKDYNNIYIINTNNINNNYYDYTLDTLNKTSKEVANELYNFVYSNKAIKLKELYDNGL